MSEDTVRSILAALEERTSAYLKSQDGPICLSALDKIDPAPVYISFDKDVVKCMLEYLGSKDNMSANEAVLRINEFTPHLADADDQYGMAIDLWRILLDTALEIPYEHPLQKRLALLFSAFQDIPLSVAKPNFTIEGSTGFTLRALPALSYDLDDRLLEFPAGERPKGYYSLSKETSPDSRSDQAVKLDKHQVDRWTRLQAFLAHLVTQGVSKTMHRAIYYLRESAIEQPYTNIEVLNCDIKAASLWFIYAGEAIFQNIKTDEPTDFDTKALRAGQLYTGTPGFRIERWNFWKERLRMLLRDYSQRLDSDVVEVATAAVKRMSVIDGTVISGKV